MKSIKTKIIVLVLAFVVGTTLAIGFTSIINSYKVIQSNSIQMMNLLCDNRKNGINSFFISIEQSVNGLSVYAKQQMDDLQKMKDDPSYVEEYVNTLLDVSLTYFENTSGAANVYIRLNPEICNSGTVGLFYGRNSEANHAITQYPLTDILLYNSDDTGHVGWYYQAKQNGESTWIGPYYNENTETEVISYSVPIYYEDTFIGIAGMDIDFEVVKDIVSDTHLYSSGYAYLTDKEANVVYHPNIEQGTALMDYNDGEFKEMALALQAGEVDESKLISYMFMGEEKKTTFRVLTNGLRMIVSVPKYEINEQARNLIWQMLCAMFIIILVACFFSLFFARKIVQPLLELTKAAKQIALGNLDVDIQHQSKDEVGQLTDSFRKTVVHLDKYFKYINKLAYQDSLTGVKNMTAYTEKVSQCNEQIQDETFQFAVVVFDLNGLKYVNDTYGHSFGDQMIMDACYIICSVFKYSPVYRIGGDEFVVYLTGRDYKISEALLAELQKSLDEYNSDEHHHIKIEVARGIAYLRKDEDQCYQDVFKRADTAMYENKAYLKKEK